MADSLSHNLIFGNYDDVVGGWADYTEYPLDDNDGRRPESLTLVDLKADIAKPLG